jgi:hypothetical protein
MNEQKEREDFQSAAWSLLGCEPGCFGRDSDGDYVDSTLSIAWDFWISRAKLEPQLPLSTIRECIRLIQSRPVRTTRDYVEEDADERHVAALRALLPPSPNEEQKA